ncbi:hypothetical protein [Pseudonocardia thermophila]|uniref:hypothetical protein n=1 Tax=Pseudonocardia thermophila TaxID=1848 RepID=UPI00248DF37C|nr:hypothetical protein [Pseudonocardia thermophila]
MRYTRIYTAEDGGSRFEDVEVSGEVRTSPVSSGVSEYAAPIPAKAVVLRRVVRAHPGEPHVAPRRQFMVNLRGTVEIETSDGAVRRFGPGELVLVEDTTGIGHITREVGDEERLSMFVELAD